MSSFHVVYLPTFTVNSADVEGKDSTPLEEKLKKYLTDYTIEDNYVVGYITQIETFKEIMAMMKDKGFAFSVRDSDVRQKQRDKHKQSTVEEMKPEDPSNHSVFYQLRAMPIKFFGLPFTIEKTTNYHCAYGCKYYKSKFELSKQKGQPATDSNAKKKRNVGSKKMGCLAKMTLKNITVYPEYRLDVESDWRKKKKLIENLRRDLTDDVKKVEKIQRYYISVSVQSSHNHPPIIAMPKPKIKKVKAPKDLVKNSKTKKLKTNEILYLDPVTANNEIALNTFNISTEETTADQAVQKSLNLQDENFFHTLVKFPATQQTYDESDFKPNVMEVDINEFDQTEDVNNEATRTVQIEYQYEPSIQYLQSIFRERLKRLYTLSEACLNGPLLVKLSENLEQIEVSLSNDVGGFTSM